MGKDEATLLHLLGKPLLVRREAPAQVWQYHGETCVLDFFLYQDAGQDAGPFVVTYTETRAKAEDKVTPETCLEQVLAKPIPAAQS
ncbi:MAG: hypothetical protein A2516_07585 [Alphaproteobacteria bacterium RIFOXYD12_FULL_60_8]|nr:MAG: hypothetical protein A2516_07585 [Alphaproteobacteria bacterium RIFOXYD12_FULL_60_8]